jgi:hypothetical protein
MKLAAMFLLVTSGYVLLYGGYTYGAKTMTGRVVYTAAVVVGTLLGSTIGRRLFE